MMREAVKAMLAADNGGSIVNVTTAGSLHTMLNGNEAYSSFACGRDYADQDDRL